MNPLNTDFSEGSHRNAPVRLADLKEGDHSEELELEAALILKQLKALDQIQCRHLQQSLSGPLQFGNTRRVTTEEGLTERKRGPAHTGRAAPIAR